MEGKEENVRAEAPGAGHAAEAEEKRGPALLGKFRSADALAEAYSALEAEFTRRSQRLRELERRAENPGGAGTGAPVSEEGEEGAVRPERRSFPDTPAASDATIGRGPALPQAEKAPPTGGGEVPGGSPEKSPEKSPGESPEKSPGESPESPKGPETIPERGEMSEEELYRAASGSERVRLKIVGDYLASLKTPGAPLVRGGGGTLAAPPRKARSIDEAGNMALLYFKKGEQA